MYFFKGYIKLRCIYITTILIVEDDHLLIESYKLLLEGYGFEIVGVASSGQMAIDKFKSFLRKPDLILMDYRMPVKNGIETTEEILNINHNTKVIFITSDEEVKE